MVPVRLQSDFAVRLLPGFALLNTHSPTHSLTYSLSHTLAHTHTDDDAASLPARRGREPRWPGRQGGAVPRGRAGDRAGRAGPVPAAAAAAAARGGGAGPGQVEEGGPLPERHPPPRRRPLTARADGDCGAPSAIRGMVWFAQAPGRLLGARAGPAGPSRDALWCSGQS